MPHTSPLSSTIPPHYRRILIVEDDRVNCEILGATLEQEGYSVETATNGRTGLETLRRDSDFGVVIADRLMPQMDGLALFAAMKQNKDLRDLPVIMQTGAAAPEEIVEGIKAGVYYYLTKPYENAALLALVSSALRYRWQQQVFLRDHEQHRQTMSAFKSGTFEIRNLNDAQTVAQFLGSLFPRPELAVFGLYELLLNGIEHGHLQIGLEGKGMLLARGNWEQEIAARLKQPENLAKKIILEFAVTPEKIEVTITDDGKGFDPRPYMEIEPARATRANGRGIAKANMLSFDRMVYKSPGNSVSVTALFDQLAI